MSEFKIGQHNIEIKYSGTGAFSPWHHKAYESIPITYECKKILKLTNSQDNIGKYVLDYILDYMSHNYLGRNVKEPTLDDINIWCGNGEFPFLEVYLIRNADGVVSLAYYLAR